MDLADGIENTSHQMRCCCGGVWESRPLPWSFRFSWHCRSGYVGAPVTYLSIGRPVFGSVTVWYGSNTSTIWNGLRWMWNGWSIRPGPLAPLLVVFTTFHSS